MSDIADIQVPEPLGLTLDEVFPNDQAKTEVATFLEQELNQVISDRSGREEQWRTWRRHRLARPESASRSYPWENASNICTNMTLKNTNTIFATVKNKFSRKKPFLLMKSSKDDYKDHAQAMGRFMNTLFESKHHINIRKANLTLLYDLVSLGTEFVKVPWKTSKWQFKRAGQVVDKVRYNGPAVIPIQIDDFFCKQHWFDLQNAPWFALRTRYQEHELKQLVFNGIFDQEATEKIMSGPATDVPDGQKDNLEITDGASQVSTESPTMEFEIFEVNIFWDLDEDGVPEDLKLWYHKDSGTIIRAEFNELGVRDVVRVPYMNLPFELYGAGIGWMLEQTQEEVDTLHNIRMNSLHISSLQMFITKQGSKLKQLTFKPLKNIEVEDPSRDFLPIKFPDVSQTTLQAEELTKQEGAFGVGAGSAMSGQPNTVAKSRVTTSGEMLQVERGSMILESYIQNIEEGYAEIAMLVLYQLIYNSELTIEYLLPLIDEKDHQMIRDILNMNVEDIPAKFYFQIQTTDVDMTEDAKRQKAMGLQQMYDQYTQTIMAYSMQLPQVPPQLSGILLKFIVGQSKMMEQNLTLFGEMNPEDFVMYYKDLEAAVAQVEAQQAGQLGGQVGQQASPAIGMGGSPMQPGMAGVQGSTGGAPAGPAGTIA